MEISDVYWKDTFIRLKCFTAAATAKSLQSCPTLCDPIDGGPSGSTVPGILQARTLEWVAISFSNAWKWKVKVKSLSHVRLLVTPWTAAYQAPPSMGFSRQEYWSGVPLPSLTSYLHTNWNLLLYQKESALPMMGSQLAANESRRYLEGLLDTFRGAPKHCSAPGPHKVSTTWISWCTQYATRKFPLNFNFPKQIENGFLSLEMWVPTNIAAYCHASLKGNLEYKVGGRGKTQNRVGGPHHSSDTTVCSFTQTAEVRGGVGVGRKSCISDAS